MSDLPLGTAPRTAPPPDQTALGESDRLIDPALVLRVLLLVTLALCLASLATIPVAVEAAKQDLPIAFRYRFFMLDEERSIGTWFSTVLLAANMLLLVVNGTVARRLAKADTALWLMLAGIFALLSLDEMMAFHEKLGEGLRARFQLDGFLRFAWVIPGAAFTGVVGLAFVGFLRRLPHQTALLFVLAGAIYISGALITEILEAFVVSIQGRGALYYTMVVVEEGMEMAGQAVFCFALLQHLALSRTGLRIA